MANVHSMCDTFLPALFNFAIEALKTIIDVLIIAYRIIFAHLILSLHVINKSCLMTKFSS